MRGRCEIEVDVKITACKALVASSRQYTTMTHGIRELSPLSPGDSVWIPDWSSEAQVSNQVDQRSYEVAPNTNNLTHSNTTDSDTRPEQSVRRSGRTARAPDRFDLSWTKYSFLYHLP